MLIDTHAHLNFNNYKNDVDQVIRKSLDENIWMINVGVDYKTSKRALEIANRYQRGVYATAGLHPIHLEVSTEEVDGQVFETRGETFNKDAYEKLVSFEKTVAVGEIGLDYYHVKPGINSVEVKNKQKLIFLQQLEIARHFNKPVIIHCRQAHDDMLGLLTEFKKENRHLFTKDKPWGVMHCFSGDEDLAWKYFNLGLLISFTGLVTFSRQWDDLLRRMPLDKFMIETDCPFMTPEPFRGERNEPYLVKYVAQKVAEIRGTTIEKISDISTKNALSFFNIS